MLFPAVTGSGAPTLVTLRSACPVAPTAIFTVAVLSPGTVSRVAVVTVAVSVMIVPVGVPAVTFTTNWKLVVVFGARVVMLQLRLPVPPTGGSEQVHVPGVVAETKVVLAGTASVNDTVAALLGPRLITLCV